MGTADPPILRTATCSCRQLQLRCIDAPASVSLCHCLECQRRTGSLFGVAAWYRPDQVATSGTSLTYIRAGESGQDVAFRFCPQCGSTVFWNAKRRPDMIAVAAGAFADPTFPRPKREFYTNRRHPWLDLTIDESTDRQ